jgi:hypothetical protein
MVDKLGQVGQAVPPAYGARVPAPLTYAH